MAEIGRRIKAAREAAGLTQAELAAKLGYKSKSTINKIETGINDISQSKVEAFAAALGTTPAYLMGWDPSAEDDTSEAPAYYLNPETAKAAQEMLDNKELRVLFDAARDAKPEDLKTVYDMLMALKRKEQGDPDGWA